MTEQNNAQVIIIGGGPGRRKRGTLISHAPECAQ